MRGEKLLCTLAHFADWGMEVHAGAPGKDSKSEILFCPAPPHVYSDSATFDGADLSDVQLPAGRSMPIVTKFPYLGDFVAADGTDTLAVEARIAAAGKAFGALRKCLFRSQSVSRAAIRPSAPSTRASTSPSSSTAVSRGASRRSCGSACASSTRSACAP